ncbi:tetratricopeptide repeat protein [Pelagicoccus enzymogenes]|uniref:tetratricopeptide repeat protein n=1 Tax=Pelagicoccus enzymogenes TaxID=2773457 RepID=UPI00178758C3|nr:tetratricopeptide repeat protein [Pelagicoccus enzymogenes]MDQ8196871.1 tetratricopeptide repeat protein [Pelagicoccus enzymogenes]
MIPTSTRVSYANGYIELGMLKEASEELDAIEPSERLMDDVLLVRSRLYLEARNWELMEAVSKQLAEQTPSSRHAWINWAYALREMERNEEAKNIALRALVLHPQEPVLWFNLACYCSLLGQYQDASDHLDSAIKLDRDFEQESVDDPDLEGLWNWLKSQEQT